MDPIAVTAAGGLRARIQSLDLLANNLANATTAGYKLDREFYNIFGEEDESMSGGIKLPNMDKHWTDFAQGTLETTGNPLDLGLSGKGFFAVNGPNGPLYTRNGSFKISSKGDLTGADGYAVRGAGGSPIHVQPGAAIEIAADGSVSQNGAQIGQLEIVDFSDPQVLAKFGHSYFKAPDGAKTITPTGTTVAQGKLEASNVGSAESAVRLVGLMRHSEMLQKAITISTDMNRKTVQEVAKVGA
jgi:flagellar basal-body rod protein FlgF